MFISPISLLGLALASQAAVASQTSFSLEFASWSAGLVNPAGAWGREETVAGREGIVAGREGIAAGREGMIAGHVETGIRHFYSSTF